MSTKNQWTLCVLVVVFGAGFVVFLLRRNTISSNVLAVAIQRHGAAIVTAAKIERSTPNDGKHHVIGNATLLLVQPRTIKSMDQISRPAIVVVPEAPWVLGQIEVAKATKEELKLSRNQHAILPSDVKIYEIDHVGNIRLLESGNINYLLIEDNINLSSQ